MINFLMVGSQPELKSNVGDGHHSGPIDGAVVKHSFNLAWRILDSLPPSADFFQNLFQDLERQHLQVTVSTVMCMYMYICTSTQPCNSQKKSMGI